MRRKHRRVRVRLHAYFRKNLGDDLFVTMLCQRYPDVQFYTYCDPAYMGSLFHLENLHRIPKLRWIDGGLSRLGISFRLNAFVDSFITRRCAAIVNIGGSILMQGKDWRAKMPSRERRFGSSKPTFVVGANFGPYEDPAFLSAMKRLLARTEDLCVRDLASAEALSDVQSIRYAPDILFNQEAPPDSAPPCPTVVISVIRLQGRPGLSEHCENYQSAVLGLILESVNAGLTPVLMGFCAAEGDCIAAHEIRSLAQERLGLDSFRVYCYDGDRKEALSILSHARLVVASRFHAMILGWAFRKPVIALSYSDKMTNVIRDLPLSVSWAKISHLPEATIESVASMLAAPISDTTELAHRAEEHFRVLDRFVSDIQSEVDVP